MLHSMVKMPPSRITELIFIKFHWQLNMKSFDKIFGLFLALNCALSFHSLSLSIQTAIASPLVLPIYVILNLWLVAMNNQFY